MFLVPNAPQGKTGTVLNRHGWTVETYRDLTDGVGLGLFQTTADGRVLFVNHRMAQILGYSDVDTLFEQEGDLVERHYVRSADRERYRAEMERAGEVADWQLEIRRCDGSTIWVSETARLLAARDDRPASYVGVWSISRNASQSRNAWPMPSAASSNYSRMRWRGCIAPRSMAGCCGPTRPWSQ